MKDLNYSIHWFIATVLMIKHRSFFSNLFSPFRTLSLLLSVSVSLSLSLLLTQAAGFYDFDSNHCFNYSYLLLLCAFIEFLCVFRDRFVKKPICTEICPCVMIKYHNHHHSSVSFSLPPSLSVLLLSPHPCQLQINCLRKKNHRKCSKERKKE